MSSAAAFSFGSHVLFWFAGLSFALVWAVFRDTSIDYRLVMAGALLPDVVDIWLGGARYMHSVVASALALVGVMLFTRHRRVLRRRLLALPVGMFCHLLLDGMWARTSTFWWPFVGDGFTGDGLPSLERPLVLVGVQEAIGVMALGWCWLRFELGDADRRRPFLRTGRLARELA